MSYLDLDPDVVADAGRRTAATASTWEEWANRSETALRNAVDIVHDNTVSAAIEDYLSALNPTMKGVAKQVDALGTNTVSASNSVANSDTSSAALLSHHGLHVDSQASVLRRPINP